MPAVVRDQLQLLQPVQALAHGHEVGEQSAQPPLVDVGHAAALGLFRHRLLRLPLGADEEDRPALGRQLLDVLEGLLEQAIGLLEVDDVDPVALTEDVFLHLRVPTLGLVPEVDPRLEQLLHGDRRGHARIHGRRQKTPP